MLHAVRLSSRCYLAHVAVLAAACLSLPKSPTAIAADDVVITASQFGQTVDVRVGQSLSVRPPIDNADWQVDFAGTVLEMVTPADRVRTPGPDGWRLKAIAVGLTDLALTPILRIDPSTPPPPAPPRFVVTVRVGPQ